MLLIDLALGDNKTFARSFEIFLSDTDLPMRTKTHYGY